MSMQSDALEKWFEDLGPWNTRFHIAGGIYGGGYEVGEDDLFMREFLERYPLPGRVLEVGCMEGGRTFPLARRAGHVVAVDGRREHLERGRFIQRQLGISNVTFLELDLEACDLETLGTFDAVYNVGLLYHLAKPHLLLRQLSAVAPEMFLWTYVADEGDDICDGYRGAWHRENPTDVIGGLRSRSFRPTREELLRMLAACGFADREIVREEEQSLVLYCRTGTPKTRRCRIYFPPVRVAVIVSCHNYAHHLDDCLTSIVAQTRRPDEVLVVDDASEDNTAEVAARWADRGVRYLRVEHRNVRLARLAGLNATDSEIVSFVDADDLLTPDYIRAGLEKFDRYDVGLVYSDMARFGREEVVTRYPEEVTQDLECWTNYAHCASLVRREALEMSGALEVPVDPKQGHEDWLAWRRLLEQGWKARKQTALYCYRRHAGGASLKKAWDRNPYFRLRCLEHETITLFVPLSGRLQLWPRFAEFFERQSWPHERTRLFLFDTSQDPEFARTVRRWLAECDYTCVRYEQDAVGPPGLADRERRGRADVQDAVRLAVARIYNRMARETPGNFVWVVEDDVLPPTGAAELLLRAFDQNTASVAGPYRSRYHEGYVAWTEGHRIITERGEGVQAIEGNGFGCVMLRAAVLKETLFTCRQGPHVDFDPAFYARLVETGREVKLCWDAECEHLDAKGGSS